MRIGKIKSKHVFKELRFSGGYFLNEDAVNSRLLEENADKCKPLKELANVFNPPIFKRQFCEKTERAIPYCQSSDVTNALEGSDVYINKAQAKKIGAVVKEKQTLVTGFGTIGNTRLVNELSDGIAYANNVCRIEVNDETNYGYIYALITSKYGRSQLNKNASGSVVRYIEAPGIKETLVPILSESKQQKIHNLIVEATNLRVEANSLLSDSRRILYENLGITEDILLELNHPLERTISSSFKISSSELNSYTFRGRNYSPRKQKIISVLKSENYNLLRDLLECDPFYGSRYKRLESSSHSSIELLSQGNIFDLKPNGRFISRRNIKNIEKEIVSKNTILIPAQGTLGENEIFGRAKYVWGYLEGKLVAGHAMRFIPDLSKVNSGYLFTVLNSELWFRLFRNTVYGTNLLGFIVPLLNELPIPRLEEEFEVLIDKKVKMAYENITKGNLKEYEAINLIENEIEQWQES